MAEDKSYDFSSDNRSVETFLFDYKALKEKYEPLEEKAWEEKKEVSSYFLADEKAEYAEYNQMQDFLCDVRDSHDFVQASTIAMTSKENPNLEECRSLLSDKELYANLKLCLTGGDNKDFKDEVEKTRTEPIEPEIMGKQEYFSTVKVAPKMKEIKEAFENLKEQQGEDYSIKRIDSAVKTVEEEMEYYSIDKENVISSTLSKVLVEDKDKSLTNVLAVEDIKAPKIEQNYEIVLMKDDKEVDTLYAKDWDSVISLSVKKTIEEELDVIIKDVDKNKTYPTIEAALYKENYDSLARLQDNHFPLKEGNFENIEYEKPKPQKVVVETTIDPSLVTEDNNLALETVDDLGTKEIKEIEDCIVMVSDTLIEKYENSSYNETPEEPKAIREEKQQLVETEKFVKEVEEEVPYDYGDIDI